MRDRARNYFQQYGMLIMSKTPETVQKSYSRGTANFQQGTRYNKIPGWPLGWFVAAVCFACCCAVCAVCLV